MPKIQMRRDTAANWSSVNPVLASGEWAVETDTTKSKVGDGVTHYNDLDYIREEDNEWVKPSEWIDIRSAAIPNSIYYLVGHSANYSKYPEFCVKATVSNNGTYDVFIDGIKCFTSESGTLTTIVWSELALVSGWDVTYPEALRTHVIRVTPTLNTNSIQLISNNSVFCGILMAHITCESLSSVHFMFDKQQIMEAVTTSSGVLSVLGDSLYCTFRYCYKLQEIPIIDGNNSMHFYAYSFDDCKRIKKIHLRNIKTVNGYGGTYSCISLRNIIMENCAFPPTGDAFNLNYKLKNIPSLKWEFGGSCHNLVRACYSLDNTFLDASAGTQVNRITLNENGNKISGIKGLIVSPEAPFNNTTQPQLSVANTGLDRTALVKLFKSMPYNVAYYKLGNPTIVDGVVSGFSAGNCIHVNHNIDFNTNFNITCKFRYSAITDNLQCIFSQGARVYIYIDQTGTLLARTQHNNTFDVTITTSVSINTDYIISFVKEGDTYKLIVNGNTIDTKTSTNSIDTTSAYPTFGATGGSGSDPFTTGYIDMNNTYIKINGIPWFGPGVTKNLVPGGTLVGSPTITNGIASGFSSSKYIETTIPSTAQSIEIGFKFSRTAITESGTFSLLDSSSYKFGFYTGQNNVVQCYIKNGSTSEYKQMAPDNSNQFLKVVLTPTTLTTYSSSDGITYTQHNSYSGDFSLAIGRIELGTNRLHNNWNSYIGSIDLNNTYIKVDNSYVYRGMVPQTKTCSIVGCTGTASLTQADKNIALNKGWELTLS